MTVQFGVNLIFSSYLNVSFKIFEHGFEEFNYVVIQCIHNIREFHEKMISHRVGTHNICIILAFCMFIFYTSKYVCIENSGIGGPATQNPRLSSSLRDTYIHKVNVPLTELLLMRLDAITVSQSMVYRD